MLKTVSFSALQAGEQVELSPGDTLEVVVSFNYLLTEPAAVELWLHLVVPPGRDYGVKQEVYLEASDGTKEWSGPIQMPIEASGSLGRLKNYTYDLYFEMPYRTSEVAIAEGAVVITGISDGLGGIMDIIPMMMIVMMMSMIMPMMEEGI